LPLRVRPARVEREVDQLEENPAEFTRLLRRACSGDDRARDDLLPRVYASLRAIADGAMRRFDAGSTLQPTAGDRTSKRMTPRRVVRGQPISAPIPRR